MVREYPKGEESQLSENFKSSDFDCPCEHHKCTTTFVDEALIEALEELTQLTGQLKIIRGFLCRPFNKQMGGYMASQHCEGKAAELKSLKGLSGNALSRYAERIKAFNEAGIGIGRTYTHVDVGGYRARWNELVPC